MNESTSKIPWRERARHLLSSKHSPMPSSIPAVSTSQPKITGPGSHQLLKALEKVPSRERILLERYIPSTSTEASKAVTDALSAVMEKRQICLDKRWSLNIGGRTVVLREVADNVIRWLDRFKGIGDVAVSADPIHAGLPWAAFRLLLQV